MIGNLYWQQDQPRWWQGWSVTLNNDVVNVLWWPMCQKWLPCNDLSNDDWLPQDNPPDDTWLPYDDIMDKLVITLIIKGWHLMTLDDSNRQFLSSKLKVACLEENSIYVFLIKIDLHIVQSFCCAPYCKRPYYSWNIFRPEMHSLQK